MSISLGPPPKLSSGKLGAAALGIGLAITIAWGPLQTFDVDGQLLIQGRRFEVLPGGTMFRASGVLSGVVGLALRRLTATKFEVMDSRLTMIGWAGTSRDALLPLSKQIGEAYQRAQLQFGAAAME